MFRNINKIVRFLVVADFFYNSAFASFAPIFAIFIVNKIDGGSIAVAGFSTALYWGTKSFFQLPVSYFLDKNDGERDDYKALFFGYFLSSFVPIIYIFVSKPWQLYLTQVGYGFIMALAVPAWYAIFTRHIDKGKISFEWSLDSSFSLGLATAIAAAVGGYVANAFGFKILFAGASLVSFIASLFLLILKKYLLAVDLMREKK